jgi:SAM-dependent methyltransferase
VKRLRAIEFAHGAYVFKRRVRVLAGHLAAVLPQGVRVLDVGCGDGRVARAVMDRRPDVTVEGIDVLVREAPVIPVRAFDGTHIPFADGSFDLAMFIDVLHHTPDPLALMREAVRVSRTGLVIKDHTREGLAAGLTLRFMDFVGNARHGVSLPYNFWRERQWRQAFAELGLTPDPWVASLHLYPWWADWWAGRRLHFIALLRKTT